jgi:hypothetical protein
VRVAYHGSILLKCATSRQQHSNQYRASILFSIEEEEEEELQEEDSPHISTWRNVRMWVDFFHDLR